MTTEIALTLATFTIVQLTAIGALLWKSSGFVTRLECAVNKLSDTQLTHRNEYLEFIKSNSAALERRDTLIERIENTNHEAHTMIRLEIADLRGRVINPSTGLPRVQQ